MNGFVTTSCAPTHYLRYAYQALSNVPFFTEYRSGVCPLLRRHCVASTRKFVQQPSVVASPNMPPPLYMKRRWTRSPLPSNLRTFHGAAHRTAVPSVPSDPPSPVLPTPVLRNQSVSSHLQPPISSRREAASDISRACGYRGPRLRVFAPHRGSCVLLP